jgi:carboxyl-terminal processing protease
MNMGFPDVCLTPAPPSSPVPIPYPNIAQHAMASPFVSTVLLSNMPAINLGSQISMTSGMEAGVANPLYKQAGAFTMGDSVVMISNLPGIALTHQTSGNQMNNANGAVLVPGVTTVLFSLAGDAGAGEVESLQRAVGVDVDEADAPAVHGARFVADGVGYIAVRRFTAAVPSAVHHALSRLVAEGLAALVLDLRGNGGGDANAALALAGDFVESGSLLAVALDGDGDTTHHRARGGAPYRFPLVIVVDRGTASAAELVAGSLQRLGRAVVVGEATYGKSVASSVVPLPEGARYDVVARFVVPSMPLRPDMTWDDLLSLGPALVAAVTSIR